MVPRQGTGAGFFCHGSGRKLSFSIGRYTTVFQAEVYAIKACTVENLDRNYKNRNFYILSDSQAAIKELAITRSPHNWSRTATNPSHNWPNITGFNWYGCQVIRISWVMKLQINWQEQDLNICSQDLNHFAASQLELPRKQSGTGWTEITKNTAFLGMKSVSNQRSLTHSEQELASVTVQFIQAVKKMVERRSVNCIEFKYN
jgi:hypothetical protein